VKIVSARPADTKNSLPVDTINDFCSSVSSISGNYTQQSRWNWELFSMNHASKTNER
jgi:hypothetical protein